MKAFGVFARVVLLRACAELLIGQLIWGIHTNNKFNHIKTQWKAAHAEWQLANARGDYTGSVAAFQDEELFLSAEMRAHKDMLINPLRWSECWDVDYVAEERNTLTRKGEQE